MATFEIVEGAPGQGKSLYTARKIRTLIGRNKKLFARMTKDYELKLVSWEKSQGLRGNDQEALRLFEEQYPRPVAPLRRLIASNMKLSPAFEQEHEGWIMYWSDMQQLVQLKDCDVVWDEIATELDARNWPLLSTEVKRFLSQYRKRGIDIYANTQDFSMVDARCRLMITGVLSLMKIVGSPDISSTKPKPKTIWGVVWIRRVMNWRETNPEKKKFELLDLFNFMLIERDLVEIYDTRQDITLGEPPPLRHEVRICELHGTACDFRKVTHT